MRTMIQFRDFNHALETMCAFIEMEQAGDETAINDPVYIAAVHHVFENMDRERPDLAAMFHEGFKRFFPELADSRLVNSKGEKCYPVSEVAKAFGTSEEEILKHMEESGAEPSATSTNDLHRLQ